MKSKASARGCAVEERERDGVDEGGAVRGRGTRRRTQRPLANWVSSYKPRSCRLSLLHDTLQRIEPIGYDAKTNAYWLIGRTCHHALIATAAHKSRLPLQRTGCGSSAPLLSLPGVAI